jgi:hypothetical protein
MPTVLFINGWRFFFYMNEGNEPLHIHCEKAEKSCKYWLDSERFTATEAFSYNMTPRDTREVKRIIYEYFEVIEQVWKEIHGVR